MENLIKPIIVQHDLAVRVFLNKKKYIYQHLSITNLYKLFGILMVFIGQILTKPEKNRNFIAYGYDLL